MLNLDFTAPHLWYGKVHLPPPSQLVVVIVVIAYSWYATVKDGGKLSTKWLSALVFSILTLNDEIIITELATDAGGQDIPCNSRLL